MSKVSRHTFDVVVVGGGPAGMAAASSAAAGYRVAVVDENPGLGGQIWRGQNFSSGKGGAAGKWYRRFHQRNIEYLAGLRVYDSPEQRVLHAESPDGLCELRYHKLVVATGARERFLPFPGWTLRNVVGAGALQAMVKCGLPIEGKRVVVAGSGPLLLAVAAYLQEHGARVIAVCEQASLESLAKFSFQLLGNTEKLVQGLLYRVRLRGVPYHAGSWPLEARGERHIESVVISRGNRTEEVACDYLACGFHLVPNVELADLLGCKMTSGFVDVDELQQTSVPDIYCAGEPTGIGGLELSLLEGEIAGLASSGLVREARMLLSRKQRMLRFSAGLERAFALRAELRSLARENTLVCRCEDVRFGQIAEHESWRSAKLHTRCGMGACQGRVCGTATEFLFGWNADSVRPPMLPVRYGTMAASTE